MRWSLGLTKGLGVEGGGGGGVLKNSAGGGEDRAETEGEGEDEGAGVGDFAPVRRTAETMAATRDNQRVRDFMKGSFPG